MNVEDAVATRISTRAFQSDALPEAELRDWIAAAQRAPSGGNVQPYRVIAVSGDAKEAVVALATSMLAQSPKGQFTNRPIYPEGLWEPFRSRRFRVGEMMYETLGIPRHDKAARLAWFSNNFRFFGAPSALFFVTDSRLGHGQWAHMGMFMQTLALLAEARGWGTCMQECWGILRPALHEHFELAEEEMVYCGMAVGLPDRDAPVNTLRSERAPVDEIAEFRGFS